MKVYKYRGGNKKIFERDLSSLENNYFWAPKYSDLNDPCEALIVPDSFKRQTNFFQRIFSINDNSIKDLNSSFDDLISRRFETGIYSLSKSFKDELSWAHYANEHYGFCIEYDLEILTKDNIYQDFYHFPVSYSKTPPSIGLEDLMGGKAQTAIKKLAGFKSKSWAHEEEIRIISDKIGKQYYDYTTVTGIYFGLRMSEENKKEIMKRMKGRGITYYQIELEEKSYQFNRKIVSDIYHNSSAYLFEIPPKQEQESSEYEIVEKSYNQYAGKAMVTIRLPNKITKSQLSKIARDIKEKIFQQAERVFMTYFLPNMEDGKGAWATTHFTSQDFNIKINGLTISQEKEMIKALKKETRDIIGMWLNEPFINSSMILYREKDEIFLETKYADGSNSKKQMIESKTTEGIKYDDLDANSHGEYFIVDTNKSLKFCSPDGVFKTLVPIKLED